MRVIQCCAVGWTINKERTPPVYYCKNHAASGEPANYSVVIMADEKSYTCDNGMIAAYHYVTTDNLAWMCYIKYGKPIVYMGCE